MLDPRLGLILELGWEEIIRGGEVRLDELGLVFGHRQSKWKTSAKLGHGASIFNYKLSINRIPYN